MPKPIIFVSKCLGFAACRWNGAMVPDEFVKKLKNHVEIVTSCPECEIGLGVPRDPIRIVYKGSSFRLMQLNTGKDVTGPMRKFTDGFLSGIREIDGFILKDRSPSCGIKDVKVYPDIESSSSLKKKSGFFGEEALKRFSNTAIESETRLTNFAVREHFLIRIFTLARFREVKKSGEIKSLIWFHAAHKLLFMVYSRKKLKIM